VKLMKRFFVFVALLMLAKAQFVWASGTDIKDDPRVLSTINLQPKTSYSFSFSNDGKSLYIIYRSPMDKDGRTPTDQAKLYIYDISDLRQPHLISTTEIGKIDGYQLEARNGVLFYFETLNNGFAIIDARDSAHPKIAGHIDAAMTSEFRVSDDGNLLVFKDLTDGGAYKFFDTSDPSAPKPVPADKYSSNVLVTAQGKWNDFDRGHGMDGIHEHVRIEDIRGKEALVTTPDSTGSLFHLYDLSVAEKPKLIATFSPISGVGRLVPTRQVVAFETGASKAGPSTIELSLPLNTSFNVDFLSKLYEAMASKSYCCNSNDLSQLKAAGIDKLVTEQPEGLTKGKRILMLNNYGFWLYREGEKGQGSLKSLQESAEALKAVVELSPDRAVAWLNLGDALHAQVPLVTTETEKASLWAEALKDFAHYKELSGKEASAVADMSSFDLPELVKSSKDVCNYAAQAINNKKEKEISSPEGTATADDKTITFVVGWAGGTCSSSEIKLKGDDTNYGDGEPEISDSFHFIDPGMGGNDIMIVPFRGKSYTVSHDGVMDPNSGPVCSFEHAYKPVLVENKSSNLCEKFFNGELKPNIAWAPLKEDEIEATNVGFTAFDAHFDHSAQVSFNGKESVQVAHYNLMSTGGCGCTQTGVAVLDKNKMQSLEREPNASLLKSQIKWWSCGDADADLVKEGDITYVKAWDGNKDRPSSALLQLTDGLFQPMCRIEQKLTVTPKPPEAAQNQVGDTGATHHHHHKVRRKQTPDSQPSDADQ